MADQDEPAAVVVAVVILIDCSTAEIAIVSLPIAIFVCIVRLIELEYGVLTAPRPNSCVIHCVFIVLCVQTGTVTDIVLDQRCDGKHRNDGITTRIFYIIVADYHIRVAICVQKLLRDSPIVTIPLLPGGCISNRNSGAADFLHYAIFNGYVIKMCIEFVSRSGKINAAVRNSLFKQSTVNVMDIQIIQMHIGNYTAIIRFHTDAHRILPRRTEIGNFYVPHGDMRTVAHIDAIGNRQHPGFIDDSTRNCRFSLPVAFDVWPFPGLRTNGITLVHIDHDGLCRGTGGIVHKQCTLEHAIRAQKHTVARTEFRFIHFCQRLPRSLWRMPICVIIAILGINIEIQRFHPNVAIFNRNGRSALRHCKCGLR